MRTLRAYNVKDVRTVVGILSSLAKSNLKSVLSADSGGKDVPTENAEERVGELIFNVLSECWTNSEEAVFEWFASLNSMTVDQFNSEPPDVVLDTIEAIVDRKESRDFFSRAFRLFRRIGSSVSPTARE